MYWNEYMVLTWLVEGIYNFVEENKIYGIAMRHLNVT
jgi:hypothetical protein